MIDWGEISLAKPKTEKQKKLERRFQMSITPLVESLLLVEVKDILHNTIPLRVEINIKNKQRWIKKVRKEYKPLNYDPQGDN